MSSNAELMRYVNGGLLRRTDRVLSALWSGLPYHRHATHIQSLKSPATLHAPGSESMKVEIKPYDGKNVYVLEMGEALRKQLPGILIDAVVHGSLATGEEIPYSDFDALVILRQEVFLSPSMLVRTSRTLDRLRRIFYKADPLQHHGWFVLAETDLQNYPVTYFPPELLSWSRSMLYADPYPLEIRYEPGADFTLPFIRLCESLKRKLGRGWPADVYAAKSVLSECMMLPAYYVQARDGKGMFKKFTFNEARRDFTQEEWQPMDDVSAIREHWEAWAGSAEKLYPGARIAPMLESHLSPSLLKAMIHLTDTARKKIG